MACLLGLDFGTGGVRVGVFDLDRGKMLGEREARYATRYPRPSWAEQSPTDWWAALGEATRALMRDLDSPGDPGRLRRDDRFDRRRLQTRRHAVASGVVVDGLPRCRGGRTHRALAASRHGPFGRRRRGGVAGSQGDVARPPRARGLRRARKSSASASTT